MTTDGSVLKDPPDLWVYTIVIMYGDIILMYQLLIRVVGEVVPVTLYNQYSCGDNPS